MKFCLVLPFFGLFSIVSSQVFKLNPDSFYPNVRSSICDGCTPVSKLRATAFGIEIAPHYISLAMRHANGSLTEMLKIDPGIRFQALMLAWMRASQRESSLHSTPGLQILMQRQHQAEIIIDSLRQLHYEAEHRYPGTSFEYGGVAIPDFIFRDAVTKNIVEKAINSTSFGDPKYAEHFLLYPTDFSIIGITTAIEVIIDPEDDDSNFDALVITNTSSFLSASWYQFSSAQRSIGQTIAPKPDFPYLTKQHTLDHSVPEYGKEDKAIQGETKPDLGHIRTLVRTGEHMYKQRIGAGKRPMSGHSRIFLRLGDTSDAEVHTFATELSNVLEGTRFRNGAKVTVCLGETSEWPIWASAFYVASDMKNRVDAPSPYGCSVTHTICEELKLCVRQEALGNLVLCEDTTPPQPSKFERIERSVHGGAWKFWSSRFLGSVTDQLIDNLEARLWLVYCKDGMLWSSNSSAVRCGEAVVDIENDKQGVLEDYLGAVNSVIYALSRYWIGGHRITAVLSVPIHWLGKEHLLKISLWVVSKILGKEFYGEALRFFEDFWETDVEPVLESMSQEENKGKKARWTVEL